MGDADIDQSELDELLGEMDAEAADVAAKAGVDLDSDEDPTGEIFKTPQLSAEISRPSNLELLMDITLDMTVEMGRSSMRVQDVLGVREGSVIELDRFAGEAVDVRVNGVLVARGEIVVIDENYGITISEVLDPKMALKARMG